MQLVSRQRHRNRTPDIDTSIKVIRRRLPSSRRDELGGSRQPWIEIHGYHPLSLCDSKCAGHAGGNEHGYRVLNDPDIFEKAPVPPVAAQLDYFLIQAITSATDW